MRVFPQVVAVKSGRAGRSDTVARPASAHPPASFFMNAHSRSSPPIKAATLHDVARVAGVSLITASRALGNPGIVSAKTRERVEQAVEATGYIPNLLAGGLKSKRSRIV